MAVQYLFQGWNCRGSDKYRDMIMDIGTEELAYVEVPATTIARLCEGAPAQGQEAAARDGLVAAAMGGDRMRDALVAGPESAHDRLRYGRDADRQRRLSLERPLHDQ